MFIFSESTYTSGGPMAPYTPFWGLAGIIAANGSSCN